MDYGPTLSYTIVLTLLYFISTFFSVIKLIFLSTDKNTLPVDDERRRYIAAKIENILEHKTKLVTTISFGKTVVNVSFTIFAYSLALHLFPGYSKTVISAIAISFSTIILSLFAYTIPRSLALYYHERLLTLTYFLYLFFYAVFIIFSGTMRGIHNIILKLLRFDEKYSFLSEDEKIRLYEDTRHGQALDKEEKKMIRRIFDLGETTAKEIMLPRVDIKALDITTDFQTALATIRDAGHSRIPVYKDTIDSIIGILYAKDILGWLAIQPNKVWDLQSLLKQPQFIPTSKKIDDLMRELKKNHIHMAIVVDEYGGTAGIVTLEDILEEIVGEIQDEYDSEEDPIVQISQNLYHVDPHIELYDLAERLNITIDHENEEYNTLSGLFYHEYGDVPKENTEFEYNGLRLKIIAMDNQRIEKIELEILRTMEKPVDIEKAF